MEAVGPSGLLAELEEALRRQSAAAQDDDAERTAALGEHSLGLLMALAAQAPAAGALDRAALLRLRDIAAYNQLLLRYAFTSWAALRLDRQRSAQRYNARGRLADGAARPGGANVGVL